MDCLEASNNPPKVGDMIGAQQHESREKKKRREIGTLGILRTCLFLETPGLCRHNSHSVLLHIVCTCVAAAISISVLSS